MANRLKTTYSRLLLLSPFARMAELVDAHDSNSCSERSVGSIPTSGTKRESVERLPLFFVFNSQIIMHTSSENLTASF